MIYKLEQKLGKYAIRRLPLYLVMCYAIGYLIQIINPQVIDVLSLNPYAILHGQVWRLVSWILIPPGTFSLFTFIMLYCFYSIGLSLERAWGSFYFNYYIFSGILYTIIGAFFMYASVVIFQPDMLAQDAAAMQALKIEYGDVASLYTGGSYYFSLVARYYSTYYIYMSILLAFAATYPNTSFLLMFFIPIRAKVLAIGYVLLLIYQAFVMCQESGTLLGLFVIGASLLNFAIFFLTTRKGGFRTPEQRKRANDFKKRMQAAQTARTIAKHKCAICGRTSEEYPDLEFRFCSKCDGNYEYCQEHLFTHRHFKRGEMQ